MTHMFALRCCVLSTFVLGLQCNAVGVSGPGGPSDPPGDPLVNPLPSGCEIVERSDGPHPYDAGGLPHKLSQKAIHHAHSNTNASAVADVPLGRMRTVRFLYHFSGLQKFVPADITGDFNITSTEVTVFEGLSTDKRKASVVKFTDGTGNVKLPVTAVVEGPGAFQNLWAIQLKSTGRYIDPTKPVRSLTLTVLCPMPVKVTEPVSPTLSQ